MNYRKKRKAAMGFYICAGICLVAIGIAAVVSYSGVISTPIENESNYEKLESPKAEENKNDLSSKQTQPRDNAKKSDNTAQTVIREEIKPTPAAEKEDNEKEESEDESDEPQYIEPTPVAAVPQHFVLPAKANVTKAFSAGAPVYSETMRDFRVHNAVDYEGDLGQKICAAANGTVEKIYKDPMLGNVIVIKHGGYLFSYCGMAENAYVNIGDSVTAGEEIGALSEIPCEISEKPHLHLEIYENGSAVNAQEIIPK